VLKKNGEICALGSSEVGEGVTMRGDDAIYGRLSRRAAHQRPPLGDPSWHRRPSSPGYAISQRIRKRVEGAFGWAKTVAELRKMRHRGLLKVDRQFTLAMRPMILSACLNCSLRMFNEPVRMAYRVLPLRPHRFDPHQNASATQCRTSRKPERTKIDIFSAPCQWTHPRLSV
jgi:hypothetical protein